MIDLKNVDKKTYPNLNSKKMKNRISIFEFLISNTLLILFNFVTIYPIVFIFSILNLLSSGFSNIQITLCVAVSLSFVEKLLLYMYDTDSYYYDDLEKDKNKLKFIDILNPNKRKNSEYSLENFSDIGYYFDENIKFLKSTTIDNFFKFRDNKSLKRYIRLIISDKELSKLFSKIILISKDSEFTSIEDNIIKSKVVSELFKNLIQLSIPKIVDYNNNSKHQIEMSVDDILTNYFKKDLSSLRSTNRKLFREIDSDYSDFTEPIVLNVFKDNQLFDDSMFIMSEKNYERLLKEFNNKLSEYIENKNSSKELTDCQINSLKNKLIEKYSID